MTNRSKRARGLATWSVATLLTLVTAACSDEPMPDDAPVDEARGAIVNGSIANGDPAVVALTFFGQSFCTGTLIRPNIVLTAAHCLPPNLSDFGISSYQQIEIFFGTSLSQGGTFIPVTNGWTHPGWNDNEIGYDIGLVRLQSNGPATPIPFREAPMNPIADEGDPARIVGFGITSNGAQNSSGIKRQANTTVDEVYQQIFVMGITPSGTCSGDSGGPTLMNLGQGEIVAGVHSRSDCVDASIETRVDEYLDDIYSFIGENPPPACDSDGQCASGCNAPDPDCPCAADSFCDGSCPNPTDDPDCAPSCSADGFCDVACADDPDCGGACGADGNCDASCPDDPDCGGGAGTVSGGACSADGMCESGCADPDPDCWDAGLEPVDYDGTLLTAGGCRAGGQRSSPTAWLWMAFASVVLATRRRR